MNLRVIAAPDGTQLWVSGPLRGSVYDLAAARIWGVIRALATTGLLVLADKADVKLAFGTATWPHQLVRVMLLEQLYRATTILSGHPYHRA